MKRSTFFPGHCPVRERTADGVPVGRCWHVLNKGGRCPRHGNIAKLPDESTPPTTKPGESQ